MYRRVARQELRSAFGPISFGLVGGASIVSWSAPGARDLLVARVGGPVCMYPTVRLADEELSARPLALTEPWYDVPALCVLDLDGDGHDDLIVAERDGYLHVLQRHGDFPQLSFVETGVLRDARSGLAFNIPYDNPEHPVMDDLGGYMDVALYGCPMPAPYPLSDSNRRGLVIGGWSGRLWWLADSSGGSGAPRYEGARYEKTAGVVTERGKAIVAKYGAEVSRPAELIADETGTPFLLGDGYDSGVAYRGGATRPAVYRDPNSGRADLLVAAGTRNQRVFYLRRVNPGEEATPVFRSLGELDLGGPRDQTVWGFHSKIATFDNDGWPDLVLSASDKLLLYRNQRKAGGIPEYRFERMASGADVTTAGNNFTEILTDRSTGRVFLIDNATNNRFQLRQVDRAAGPPRLSSSAQPLLVRDQHGVFTVEGETDPQGGSDLYGFNRARRWGFDGSGRQHLVVGTDRGLFYLLAETQDWGEGNGFRLRSHGPLVDSDGKVIRVHNRSCACGVDLDRDGREDLILGGASYQLGIRSDPTPGGGFYSCLNLGVDADGFPRLGRVRPLDIRGFRFTFRVNTHVHLQAVDIDLDGELEVILANQDDGFRGRIFRVSRNFVGLEYTGDWLDRLSIEENVLDVDGDGAWEVVFGGGEDGIGVSWKLERT